MKIVIIVPDGVGVRNYLYSNFIDYLIENNHEIIIYNKLSKSAIEEIKRIKPQLKNFEVLSNFVENGKARLLRESLAYGRLLRNRKTLKNYSILKFWNPSKKGIKKSTLYSLAEILGFVFSKSSFLINKADFFYEKEISKSEATKINLNKLKTLSPDFVLNLHQRATIASQVISAAKKLKIKTGTVIFSWDNVPKARLISRYDYYYVWSHLMKEELSLLYPEIASKQIKITGTPQFEFYFNKELYLEKELFFKTYGLDINRKTICYSGNDSSSPYEANYLEDICEEVSKIDDEKRPQILFRRCPVDKSSRFDNVLKKYKGLIYSIDPDWKTDKENDDSFTTIFPKYNDIILLVNTVKYSDLVINLGSTMAHDFAVLDKPCLYLNYNPVNNSLFKVEDVFNFQHFKSLKNLDAVGWINNKDEIIKKIVETLDKPEEMGKERKLWLKRIVSHPLQNNTEELCKAILRK
ncbi:hypothetical protein [Polaribacter sp. SA4-12]|uniref:hypothetical protein n=1 Tax=Polaribacter sp. SA4-12 TaxID=1312072 RepID=UPI000B3D008A|nr:hypothetical protein [Polaribacter sp. SA4-12]ARV13814.1 hypothetical protein BTO07_01045 [Polaribacter sp. SA4-12]